jgi:hypothetical protein
MFNHCLNEKDNTNALRAKEDLVRIAGGFKDKQETIIKQEVSPIMPDDEITKELQTLLNNRKKVSQTTTNGITPPTENNPCVGS